MSPKNDRDATPMISQQYGCLNKTRTIAKTIDMLVPKVQSYKDPPLAKELQATDAAEREGNSLFLKDEPPDGWSNN